jgi:hypothetical protein
MAMDFAAQFDDARTHVVLRNDNGHARVLAWR